MSWTRWLGIALLSFALAYFLVIAPQQTRLADAIDREGTMRARFEYLQRSFVHLDALKMQLRQLDRQLARLDDMLPTAFDGAAERDALQVAAESAGVHIDDLRFGGDLRREFYAEIPYTLRASGSFFELYRFLDAAYAATDRARGIDAAELRPQAHGDLLRLTLTARSFIYLEGDRP